MDACDLAACPVCGKAVFENHSEVFCGDELCVYMTATVDLHDTLARRAEIGALVEALVETITGVTIVKLSDTLYSAENPGSEHEAASLLDVLRVMAEERLGGSDVG